MTYEYNLQSVISNMLEFEAPEQYLPTAHQLANAHFD
jgi:hypothetical protein